MRFFSPNLKMMELRRMKGSIMVQWISLLQYNRSVIRPDIKCLQCAKNSTHAPSVSGSYNRQAISPAVHQMKNLRNFQNLIASLQTCLEAF